MKLEASEQEIQALAGLLDAAVKAVGLRAARDVAIWAHKLDEALSQKQNPKK